MSVYFCACVCMQNAIVVVARIIVSMRRVSFRVTGSGRISIFLLNDSLLLRDIKLEPRVAVPI